MKLISMTDFVLQDNGSHQIVNYAKFLKQPLELWMFVPCDEDGKVLEEKSIFNTTDEDYIFNSDDFDKYQKAKDRCFFEGFNSKYKNSVLNDDVKIIFYNQKIIECVKIFHREEQDNNFEIKKIEDLSYYNLQLTKTAIKQL